jgi:NADP-dependent aldehyde dehydrogenase
LLNERIRSALRAALADLDRDPDVTRLGPGGQDSEGAAGNGYLQVPVLYAIDAATATRRPELLDEHFGPTALLIRYDGLDSAAALIGAMCGQLTGTLHAEADELEGLRGIVAALEELAGRVIFNGFPTGVAITRAMQHGGPYPATTALHTSVGTTAIRRFQRPVTWQNAPAQLLPAALQDANPLGIWRLVNGEFTRDAV